MLLMWTHTHPAYGVRDGRGWVKKTRTHARTHARTDHAPDQKPTRNPPPNTHAQGVWEKDEIRKNDSFVAFEEVLQSAVELRADLVLLGGDLFHENKPSRYTLVKTIDIIRKYCLCDNPVRFQILSDQASVFANNRCGCGVDRVRLRSPCTAPHGACCLTTCCRPGPGCTGLLLLMEAHMQSLFNLHR